MEFEAIFSDALFQRFAVRFCAAQIFDAWDIMRVQSATDQDFLINVRCLTGPATQLEITP